MKIMGAVKIVYNLYKDCKKANSYFFFTFFRSFIYKLISKDIIAHHNVTIKGVRNISTFGQLGIGIDYVGFIHNKDITLLNIHGRLRIHGNVSIGRGCRLDIGEKATVSIGSGSYINPFTKFIIMHGLNIGENCAISWECHFLDDDFHELEYDGKKEKHGNEIFIGNKVWIGSNVSVYKGTVIPDGCVIASNSVVKGYFNDKRCLIAGNPAKVIKQNVSW